MAFSLYSRRALPFRYQHFLQIPYGEQSSSSHYAYAKRSRVGLSTCATCAPLARPNFNVNTQGVAVLWCATSRGSFQHSTIEPASIRTEEQSAVGFASKLERSKARHLRGQSKRFGCRNQRGPAGCAVLHHARAEHDFEPTARPKSTFSANWADYLHLQNVIKT